MPTPSPSLSDILGIDLNRKTTRMIRNRHIAGALTALALTFTLVPGAPSASGAIPTDAPTSRMTAAKAGSPPGVPGLVAETAHLTRDGVKTRVRFVVSPAQPSVTDYVIRDREGRVRRVCSKASMVNGSGTAGCYYDIGGNYVSGWTVRARDRARRLSAPVTVLIDGLDGDLARDGDSEGTNQQITVVPSRLQAASLLRYLTAVGRDQALACTREAAWDQAINLVEWAAGEEAERRPNIYTGSIALVAYGVKYMNDEVTDNPCKAITELVLNLGRASVKAIKEKRPQRVTTYSFWQTSGLDSCSAATAATGYSSRSFTFRPGMFTEQSCWAFWGALVG